MRIRSRKWTHAGLASLACCTDEILGWAAGFGAEARIGQSNWLARAEYLHYDFGKGLAQSTGTDTSATIATEGVLTTDIVRAGLSYQLN